ncbi:MAG: hypothetical protein MJ247_04600 [Alphaproteobacteria bacterium]|nr:hypothetical protein [Alphaproteobacteria bacterium]
MSDSIFDPNNSFPESKDVYFNIPLYFKLEENGGTHEFKSFHEVGTFAYNERVKWVELFGKEKSDIPFIQQIIDTQLKTPTTVCEAAEAVLNNDMSVLEGASIIRNELNNYLCYKCIHSEGTLGQMAKTMFHYEPMLLGIVAGASGSAKMEDAAKFASSAEGESYTFGYAFTMQYCTSLRPEMLDDRVSETLRKINRIVHCVDMADRQLAHITEEQETFQRSVEEAATQLQTYRNDVAEYVSKLVNELKQTADNAVTEMWNQLNLIQNDHERQLASLRQSVSSRIRYGTALDYWNNQLAINQKSSNQATLWYVISGVFSIILMCLMGIVAKKYMNGSLYISMIILMLPILASGGLFYMLIQSRSRFEKNIAQSQEKISLLETLASLETENKVQDKERVEIVESVFKTNINTNNTETVETQTEEPNNSSEK